MAISTITSAGIATDTLTAVDIADDAIGTAELANDVVISTSGNITTTGKLSTPSIVQTDAQNLSGTYSTHELIMGKTFTATGDLTVNANLVLVNMSGTGDDVTILDDGTATTITGTGTLEGGEMLVKERSVLTDMTGELGSVVTGSPALNLGNATGVLPVGVTGGSGLDGLTLGKVLQVKHVQVTAGTVTTSSATTADVPNLALAITPSATTSKIYVLATCHIMVFAAAGGWGTARLELDRTITGGSAVKVWENASTGTVYAHGTLPYGSDNLKLAGSFPIIHLDSPSTLLETTYQVQINSSQSNQVASTATEGYSEMTLMEIAA